MKRKKYKVREGSILDYTLNVIVLLVGIVGCFMAVYGLKIAFG